MQLKTDDLLTILSTKIILGQICWSYLNISQGSVRFWDKVYIDNSFENEDLY